MAIVTPCQNAKNMIAFTQRNLATAKMYSKCRNSFIAMIRCTWPKGFEIFSEGLVEHDQVVDGYLHKEWPLGLD